MSECRKDVGAAGTANYALKVSDLYRLAVAKGLERRIDKLYSKYEACGDVNKRSSIARKIIRLKNKRP